jgi:phosphoribosylanthranilate isomerase
MTRVKSGGITSPADAQVAVDAGADAIGLIFAESPRRVTCELAREILQSVDLLRTIAVGVFVDETPERMREIAEFVGLDTLQLHGEESPQIVQEMRSLTYDVVKSFRVGADRKCIDLLDTYRPTAFLLDTYVPGQPGGTGKVFDWTLACEAKRFGRVILAGGLGVDNVVAAIETAKPYGVDASSRLERRPGEKNRELVRRFVELVKSHTPEEDTDTRWPR